MQGRGGFQGGGRARKTVTRAIVRLQRQRQDESGWRGVALVASVEQHREEEGEEEGRVGMGEEGD